MVQDLVLGLPPAREGMPDRTATVVSAAELNGTFESRPNAFKLHELRCRESILSAVVWSFGKLRLDGEETSLLVNLRGEIAQEAGRLSLSLSLDRLSVARLTLSIGELHLSGAVEAESLTLRHGDEEGVLQARLATFRGFEARWGNIRASLPELSVSDLVFDWGGDAFRMEVGTADMPSLRVVSGGNELRAKGASILSLRSLGPQLWVGQTRFARGEVELALGARESTSPPAEGTRTKNQLDASLLDAVMGRVSVDVDVDVTVPILGHRRATHALRLGIDGGTLDYLQLEHGLSTLEDSLLDFSVRDEGLVLERGLPLISTRGRGKPLLIWDLDGADHRLAKEQHRIRLAVLPRYRSAKLDDNGRESGSSFKLRKLSLLNIDIFLSMVQTLLASTGPLAELTFSGLSLRGDLRQREEEVRKGTLQLGVSELRAQLRELALGTRKMHGRLEFTALSDGELSFEGLRPKHARATLEGVALANFKLL